MKIGESPGEKVVRIGLEAKIRDFNHVGDGVHRDFELDRYPYNTVRPEMSDEKLISVLNNPLVGRFFGMVVGNE